MQLGPAGFQPEPAEHQAQQQRAQPFMGNKVVVEPVENACQGIGWGDPGGARTAVRIGGATLHVVILNREAARGRRRRAGRRPASA